MIVHWSDKIVKAYPHLLELIESSRIESIIHYFINSKYRISRNLVDWIKEQYTNPSQRLRNYAKSIKTYKNHDKQVIEVLRFVKTALVYKGDISIWKMSEHWNTAQETIDLWKGDCEDGAILIYILCRLKKIPASRLFITAGSVMGGGHAWLAYKPTNYPQNFAFIDWCYDISMTEIGKREMYTVLEKRIYKHKYRPELAYPWKMYPTQYYKIWFMFNEERAYPFIRHKKLGAD